MAAPDEARAIAAMKKIQALSAEEIDALISREIGNPMLGVFSALAQAVNPGCNQEAVCRAVHLMVLSYALRVETES